MKRCITSKDFNRFLEDSLDPGSLARLQAHCRECRTCAGKLESWRKLKEKLSTASSIAIPDGFKEKVMYRITNERILPVRSVEVKQGLAVAIILTAILYGIFRPFLGPVLSGMASNLLKSLSVVLYNFLSAIGIDPSVLIRLFGNIMANFQKLLPLFMVTTALMVIAFILLIVKGRTVRQSG